MRRLRRSALSAAAALALGCATPEPILYPNATLEANGHEQADHDTDECSQLAEEYEAGSNRAGEIAGSAAEDGAVGGAAGAAGGAVGAATRAAAQPQARQPAWPAVWCAGSSAAGAIPTRPTATSWSGACQTKATRSSAGASAYREGRSL